LIEIKLILRKTGQSCNDGGMRSAAHSCTQMAITKREI
jgi:hypothetical protein